MAAGENAQVEKREPVQSMLGVLSKAVEMAASLEINVGGECGNFVIRLRLSLSLRLSHISVPLVFRSSSPDTGRSASFLRQTREK